MTTREEILRRIEEQMQKPPPKGGKISPPKIVEKKSIPRVEKEIIQDDVKMGNLLNSPDTIDGADVEVEVSFGTFTDNKFYPGLLSITQFISLKKSLTDLAVELNVLREDEETEIQIDKDGIRRIIHAEGERYERKDRDPKKSVRNAFWGYSMSVSTEKTLSSKEVPKKFVPTIIRKRSRSKFDFFTGYFPYLRFDLTVIEERRIFDKAQKSRKPIIKYEVEIERINRYKPTLDALQSAIEFVITRSQGVEKLSDAISLDERRKVVEFHNSLFKDDAERKAQVAYAIAVSAPQKEANPYLLRKGYWNKPENIKVDDFLYPGLPRYLLTAKLDGTRRFLLVAPTGTYILTPPGDIWRIGNPHPSLEGSLFDGELYPHGADVEREKEYFIFDVLFFTRTNVRLKNLEERLNLLHNALKITSTNMLLRLKPFFKLSVQPEIQEIVQPAPAVKAQPKTKKERKKLQLTKQPEKKEVEKEWRQRQLLIEEEKERLEEKRVARLEASKRLKEKEKALLKERKRIEKEEKKKLDVKQKALIEKAKKKLEEEHTMFLEEQEKFEIEQKEFLEAQKKLEEWKLEMEKLKEESLEEILGEKFTKQSTRKIEAIKPDEVIKKIYGTSIYDVINEALKYISDQSKIGYDFDGIIFQPPEQYFNTHTKKWKPSEMLTIDFLLTPTDQSDVFSLMVSSDRGLVKFTGNSINRIDGTITISEGMLGDQNISNRIVECTWDKEGKTFVPVRPRDDRDSPNKLEVAQDVWWDIHDPINESTIRGEDLRVFRRYLNRQKTNLLERNFKSGDTLMDWGCGRGGDITKWTKLGLKKVYVVEPDEEVLKEFETRLAATKTETNITVIVDKEGKPVGAEDTAVIKKIAKHISGISSFSCLTYFGKDKRVYDSMVDTLVETLPPGGKFVGIVMDGDETRKVLEENRGKYESAAVSIEQITQPFAGTFGDEIKINIVDDTSMVKDQQEWLFYFKDFQEELEKHNIKVEEMDFYNRGHVFDVLPPQSKVFSSLHRYFVFSRVVPIAKISPKVEKDKVVKMPRDSSSMLYALLYAIMNDFREDYDKMVELKKKGEKLLKSDNEENVEQGNAYLEEAKKIQMRQQEVIVNFRRGMGARLSEKIFLKLDNGEIAKAVQAEVLGEKKIKDPAKAMKEALNRMIKYYSDVNNALGIRTSGEYLSNLLGVNLVVLSAGRSIFSTRATKYPKTIILEQTPDGMYYDLIKKGDVYMFDSEKVVLRQ